MVPAAGFWKQLTGPQLSDAHCAVKAQRFGIAFEQPITFSGTLGLLRRQLQLRTGAIVSTTVTVWLHCEKLPHPSVARQVRVMTRGQKPFVIVLTTVSVIFVGGIAALLQLSNTLGTSNPHWVPHCTVLFVPQVIVGAVLSTSATVCVHQERFPQRSCTFQICSAVKVWPQPKLVVVL